MKVKRVTSIDIIKNWQFIYVSEKEKELGQDYYSSNEVVRLIPIYIFIGISLIMFVITLITWVVFKKMEFLFYAVFIASLSIFISGLILDLENFLFSDLPLRGYWIIEILAVFINASYLSFIVYYLETKKAYPRIHKVFLGILMLLFMVIILDGFFFFKENYTLHLYLLGSQRYFMLFFAIATMTYFYFFARNRLTYFVIAGLLLFVLGIIGSRIFQGSMYIILGAFLEIVIFGLGLIYKVRDGYQERLNFERQSNINSNKALRAQINPHFIFNALGSIQGFITKNNRMAALKYLSKFSRLTRNILESSIETNVVLADEISMQRII